jgi:cytochrome c-type biogenesis protein CcmF
MLIEYIQFLLIFSFLLNIVALVLYKSGSINLHILNMWPRFYFLLINFICLGLIYSYISSDFSVVNIIETSHVSLPLLYKFSGLWSNHEGSILLWLWVLSFYFFLFSLFLTEYNQIIFNKIISVQMLINSFFTLFILFTSNPILRISFFNLVGSELNPILQDPGLIIHPPFLYLGYLGISIPFCYALILLTEKQIPLYSFWTIKLFIIISWTFLTFGIFLGSWWAYHELGWGGWWFWDPVENISLMPWLVSTALIHMFILTKKQKSFTFLTLILVISTYLLSITGTFFVRSGLLSSVHSFATDVFRATFILIFIFSLLIFITIKLRVYFVNNYQRIRFFSNISKENFLFYNIIIIIIITISILIGTYSPTFFSFLLERQVSIGPSFYSYLINPFLPFIIVIMAISPFLNWGSSFIKFKLNFSYKFVGIILGLSFLFISIFNITNFIFILLLSWLILTLVNLLFLIKNFNSMILAHFAVALFIIAVIFSTFFEESFIKLIKPGETFFFKDYHIGLRSLNQIMSSNYNSIYGEYFIFNKDFSLLSLNFPDKRLYYINNIFTSKSSISSNIITDFYILLGDGNINNGWYTRVMYKPGMSLLWVSFILLASAGLKSLYELKHKNKISWI